MPLFDTAGRENRILSVGDSCSRQLIYYEGLTCDAISTENVIHKLTLYVVNRGILTSYAPPGLGCILEIIDARFGIACFNSSISRR